MSKNDEEIIPLAQKLAKMLVADPPISYNEYDHQFDCALCFAHAPAFMRKLDPQRADFSFPDYDQAAFIHDQDCPVALAQRLLSLLEV